MMDPIKIEEDICRNYLRSSLLEWLEPNGTGAFAMGTVSGANTRRYHGLLVASLRPPVERYMLLSSLAETLENSSGSFALGACQYPGTVSPTGFEFLTSFVLDPMPTWTWRVGGTQITKSVFLVPGRQAVVVRYQADQDVRLKLRPFLAFRNYHSLSHSNGGWNRSVHVTSDAVRMQPYADLPALEIRHGGADWHGDGQWYLNVEYLRELDRGLDFQEDLYTPGEIEAQLTAGKPLWIVAGSEGVADINPAALYEARLAVVWRSRLDASAAAFLATRFDGKLTILAGFPWFTDWGRDTMISLPGLLISRGLLDSAAKIIEAFLQHMDKGIIPNLFPDGGQTPEYNTADGTLWMFIAVKRYLDAGGDLKFVRNTFYPAAKEILSWHKQGTWFGIGVDPEDGLLRAGGPGTQLTWMDAKIGDWVVTPRHGKPVDINALYYNALRLTADWAKEFGDSVYADELAASAVRVRESFRSKFWNAERNCLYDAIQEQGPVAKLRPNQLFAVSLPHALLNPEEQKSVVRIVQKELLTPVGLRTLEPSDPDYRPKYGGDSWFRDSGYHQGTVWPWLIGPYIDAYITAFGKNENTLAYCEQLAARMSEELLVCGLGSIAEVYDGDAPHSPGGCPAQAWSVAELLRVTVDYAFESRTRAATEGG